MAEQQEHDEAVGYRGDEPYIFVCYAHSDSTAVMQEIVWLQNKGYNVWFDESIVGGTEWTEEIAEAIAGATHFLWFLTSQSADSRHCRNELHHALELDKKLVLVHLHEVRLTPGLRLSLGTTQSILKYRLPLERYQSKLASALARQATALSAGPNRTYRHKLAQPATPLLGRDEELARLTTMFESPEIRMVTLLGPGGVGKTQLATHLAISLEDRFAEGAAIVRLDDVQSVDLVPSRVLQALAVPFSPHDDPRRHLCNYLQERSVLLVMDNFELLLRASDLVVDILASSAGSKILVTSREHLNIAEEVVFHVDGLSVPESARTADFESHGAVRLFLERARAADSSFVLAKEDQPHLIRILELLNGMPLGIVLAAPWTLLISCREIVEEFRRSADFLTASGIDVPERHRSIRAVFEYSWRTLEDDLKQVLRKLSIFTGAFDVSAATAVAGASLAQLSILINKSLLYRRSRGWFSIHEVIRRFCEEKLSEDAALRRRVLDSHADFHCSVVEERRHSIRGKDLVVAIEEIRPRFSNLRAAYKWSIESGNVDRLDRTIREVVIFFEVQNMWSDGLSFFTETAEQIGAMEPARPAEAESRAKIWAFALSAQSLFELYLSRFDESRATVTRALKILETLDAEMEKAVCLYQLGQLRQVAGDYDAAKEALTDSVERLDKIGDRYRVNHSLFALAQLFAWRGDHQQARIHYEQAIEGCREVEDYWGLALTQLLFGDTLLANEESPREAEKVLVAALEYFSEIENFRCMARCLRGIARVHKAERETASARKLLDEAADLHRKMGDEFQLACCRIELGEIDYEDGCYDLVEQIKLTQRVAQHSRGIPAVFNALMTLSCALRDRRFHVAAAQLLGAANSLAKGPDHNERVGDLRAKLLDDMQDEFITRRMRAGGSEDLEALLDRILEDLNGGRLE